MDSEGTSQKEEDSPADKQGAPERFSTDLAKEKCKAYAYKAYIYCKEWLQGPWWFHEKEPLAKFTGWVAAFTGVLVVVSALQFCTLQSTDRTTHQALIASSRAWVGPLTITVNGVQKDKGIEGIIQYQNTGKEPATNFLPSYLADVYSIDQWNSGDASKDIVSVGNKCLGISNVPKGLQVIYPNTGFSAYQLSFDTGNEPNKIVVTDRIIAGTDIFKLQGCFVYKSLGEFHHSSFCYYYRGGNFTKLPNLSICNVGNDAD